MSNLTLSHSAQLKNIWKIFSDLVPVAHATLDAPDAVVVRVSEVVHGGTPDAPVSAERMAVRFGEAVLDKGGTRAQTPA